MTVRKVQSAHFCLCSECSPEKHPTRVTLTSIFHSYCVPRFVPFISTYLHSFVSSPHQHIAEMPSTQSSRARSQSQRWTRSSNHADNKAILKKGLITPYICALCNQGFTRKTTVKEPHFASCVKTNGNPNGVAWDDHPSCFSKRSDGSVGPSGTVPAGLSSALEVNEVRRSHHANCM